MPKEQTGLRLSNVGVSLAGKMAKNMGISRTAVVELAIRELAESEIKRGRLKAEDTSEWDTPITAHLKAAE
ncbi:MAG: hypothetical protein PVS3B3_36870 [Ktedonobacteraceae bacterium]